MNKFTKNKMIIKIRNFYNIIQKTNNYIYKSSNNILFISLFENQKGLICTKKHWNKQKHNLRAPKRIVFPWMVFKKFLNSI
jgi:hypothetical protein